MYIKFQDLSLTFKTNTQTIPIFHDLNLSFEKGSYTVIYGASGKGKSTLLNLVSGYVIPNKGKVLIDNTDISHMPEKQKCEYRNKKTGYMFQNFNLIQQLNVRDNVAVPLFIAGISKKEAYLQVENLLSKINMTSRMYEYPNTLSGGEQQRVAFARAIANNPEIILADEPIANLDRENGNIILQLFEELWKKGVTFLCVSHDQRMRNDQYSALDIETLSLAK